MMVEVEPPADKVLVAALQDGTAGVVMAKTQDVSIDFDQQNFMEIQPAGNMSSMKLMTKPKPLKSRKMLEGEKLILMGCI